jgi:hypothetical protein
VVTVVPSVAPRVDTVATAPRATGVPRSFFFAGTGVTALLTGLTIWSGVDALAGKHALPSEPEQAQNDAVLGRARRTDVLLAGAALAGIGSAVLGIWFVDWRGSRAAAGISPVPGGATFTARGGF